MKKRLVLSAAFILPILLLRADPSWTWTTCTASQSATSAEDGNLARSGTFDMAFSGNENAWSAAVLGDASVLVDGKITLSAAQGVAYSIGDNAVLTLTLPGVCNVQAVRLWTYGSNGRVGVNVASVEGRGESGDWSTVASAYDGISVLPKNGSLTATGGYCFALADSDSGNIATDVDALRVTFATMDNNGTCVNEIEVIGKVVADKTCTVTFLDKDGAVLKTVEDVALGASVEAPVPPAVDGFVFVKWDADLSKVLEDLTVRPVYVERGVSTWEDVVSYDEKTVNARLSGEVNLFAREGVVCELDQGTIADAAKGYADLSSLTNGTAETYPKCCVGTGGSLTWTLPYAQDVGTLEIYTGWGDHGRDGATIASLEYLSANATEWTKVNIDEVVYGLTDKSSDSSRYAFVATCPDPTTPMMSKAVKVRINFGKMDNDGTGIAEVCARRDMKTAFAWTSDWYDATSDVALPLADNLMRKPGASLRIVSQGGLGSLYPSINDASVLTNGVVKTSKEKGDATLVGAVYPLGDKAVVECAFDAPKNVRGLKLWTWFFEDSRDGIAVDYIEVKLKGDEFFRVVDTVSSFSKGVKGTTDTTKPYGLWAQIAAPAGEFMFNKVVALRIHFGELELHCSTFAEIEVLGSGKDTFCIIVQ